MIEPAFGQGMPSSLSCRDYGIAEVGTFFNIFSYQGFFLAKVIYVAVKVFYWFILKEKCPTFWDVTTYENGIINEDTNKLAVLGCIIQHNHTIISKRI